MTIIRYIIAFGLTAGIFTEAGPFTAVGFLMLYGSIELLARVLAESPTRMT